MYIDDISLQASSNEVTEKVATKARSSNVVIQAAQEGFQCQSCEFRSKWDTGFKVHMQCLHGDKAQADITEKYESTANYWKSGFLGTVYQRFLDVNDVINGMDFTVQEKAEAKNAILEAGKPAFNCKNWIDFPSWWK